MNYCSTCGKEIGEGAGFCRHCGSRVGVPATPGNRRTGGTITDVEYATFIGTNSDKYLAMFKKFSVLGKDNFAATWHWPAFFFGPFWMLYRKLYLWAIAALVASCIPWLNLLFLVGWGIVGYYLYYKHAKKKILEFKTIPSVNIAPAFAQVGGVHRWLLKAYVAVTLIFGVGGILLAIAIPTYVGYKKKAIDAEAQRTEQAGAHKSVNEIQGNTEPVGKK